MIPKLVKSQRYDCPPGMVLVDNYGRVAGFGPMSIRVPRPTSRDLKAKMIRRT